MGLRLHIFAATAAGIAVLACGGCKKSSPDAQPTIAASPNPVPAGEGQGVSMVTWNTGDSSDGQVYLSVDGGVEQLFGGGPAGSRQAEWINAGATYEFRLYRGEDRDNVLARVEVTRNSK